MKKREYVRISSSFNKDSTFQGHRYEFDSIEEIVDKRLAEGWTYAGFLPVIVSVEGVIREISLIFTKE